jgi:putative transposase
MFSNGQSGLLPRRFRLVLASFLQHPGLPFADTLREESIQSAFDAEGVSFAADEDSVYTPALTLWAFLSQVLFKGEQRSCVAAVARVVVLLVALERGPCSSNTGAYCRARSKLSEAAIHRLAAEVAGACEKPVKKEWLWRGRHVHLVDGTTVSMPDTPENQEAYPQPSSQEKGLGFPIARLVVLLSLATGMLEDMAMGPYTGKETGETALLRQLLGRLVSGDILLADRYYCSYFMIALLIELGIDFVTRVHQRREVDFRRGRRLGKGDHLVEWRRPERPDWMDQETYDRMPRWIQIREIHVHVHQPGFRVASLVVVTTLTDADQYTPDDIAELYGRRWLAEICQPYCLLCHNFYQVTARGFGVVSSAA